MMLIAVFILLVYSNTFDASWHLDDYANIIRNPRLHISDLYPKTLFQTFSASIDHGKYNGESLYRPAAMFTFALNWYFGQNHVFGYHLVNIAIHILTGLFLFLTIRSLLSLPRVGIKDPGIQYQAALMATLLWALHPIHTSAVTYIVQRMASMVGMFYVLGLYFYVQFRISDRFSIKFLFAMCYLLSFALAFFTKENAVLLPASTFLLEMVFFHRISLHGILKPKALSSLLVLLLFFLTAMLLWTKGDIPQLLADYGNRSYTPIERLMTESRIVCGYLYQLIYPVASQFSVEHDIVISKGLLSPWTTIVSILFIIFLAGAGLWLSKNHPLSGFAILFFFLNHSVESTILNLELIFEHRNYIPSMFLFVPISVWITPFLSQAKAKKENKILLVFSSIFITVFLIFFSLGTLARNYDWKTEKSLWEDAIEKAPGRARPYQNLAATYYFRKGDWETYGKLYQKALNLKATSPATAKMISYDGLHLSYMNLGDMEKAKYFAQKAIDTKMADRMIVNYVTTLLKTNDIKKAASLMNELLKFKDPGIVELNLITQIRLKGHNPGAAFQSALAAFKADPFDSIAVANFGYANLENHNFAKAERYLKRSLTSQNPDALFAGLCLIQNSINQNDKEKIKMYTDRLIDRYPLKEIRAKLSDSYDTSLVSLSLDDIEDALISQVTKKARALKGP